MTIKGNSPDDAAGLRRQAEELARGKAILSSENIKPLSLQETRRILQELQVHQIELEMQNTELRRSQAELDVVLANYYDLYDLAPMGYCPVSLVIDPETGAIIDANEASAQFYV